MVINMPPDRTDVVLIVTFLLDLIFVLLVLLISFFRRGFYRGRPRLSTVDVMGGGLVMNPLLAVILFIVMFLIADLLTSVIEVRFQNTYQFLLGLAGYLRS